MAAGASQQTPIRFLALFVGVAIAAPCVAVSLLALRIPATLAFVGTTILVVIGAVIANAKAPPNLATLSDRGRATFMLWLILSGVVVYRLSSLAVFIHDPSRIEYAFERNHRELDNEELTKPFFVKHNCSTCYIVAAHLAGEGTPNIYDRKHYRDAPVKTPVHEQIGETFNIDQYQYPPPFLIGPYLVHATGLDFFQIRSLWFGFSVLLFVVTSAALTIWVCGWGFSALWLIWPAILIAPTSLGALQIGNAHVFMILIAILAMILLERRHHVLGGTLLAYATVSKFFPGILIVYLLVRRDWKAVAWTVVACIGLCAATLVLFGTSPYEAFINDQLPAIASGKAFWFAFEKPGAMLSNTSVMGLFYKIKESGIATDWDPRLTAKIASWVYSLALVGIAVVAGRRDAKVSADEMGRNPLTRLRIARSWVALIVLAQARSPFLPEVYGSTAILFLLALMLPVDRASFARLFIVAAAMCLFATGLPYPMGPVRSAFDFGLSMLATVFALCLAFVMATRRCPRASPASLFSTAAHESV